MLGQPGAYQQAAGLAGTKGKGKGKAKAKAKGKGKPMDRGVYEAMMQQAQQAQQGDPRAQARARARARAQAKALAQGRSPPMTQAQMAALMQAQQAMPNGTGVEHTGRTQSATSSQPRHPPSQEQRRRYAEHHARQAQSGGAQHGAARQKVARGPRTMSAGRRPSQGGGHGPTGGGKQGQRQFFTASDFLKMNLPLGVFGEDKVAIARKVRSFVCLLRQFTGFTDWRCPSVRSGEQACKIRRF
jgi:hypothetical protein